MALDLTHRQISGIQRYDLLIEAVQPGHALWHQPRFERPSTIPRDRQIQLACVRQNRLRRSAIPAVTASLSRGNRSLLIAEVMRQLGVQRAFYQRLLQLAEKPAFA